MNGESVLEELTIYSRYSLAWCGVWPSHRNKKLSIRLFVTSVIIMTFTVFLPQSIRLFQVWGNLDLMTKIISTAFLPYIVVWTKMGVLFRNKKQTSIIYDHMIDHWNSKKNSRDKDIMIQSGNKGKHFTLICVFLSQLAVVARFIEFIFKNMSNWKDPELHQNYTLYVEAYYPFTWNYSPVFEITTVTQIFGIFLGTIAYTGTDGFISFILLHLAGQYQILTLNLSDIVNDGTNSWTEFNQRFGDIVNVHEHINSCIKILEETFNLMFLIQLLYCSIQFCLQGFLLVLLLTSARFFSIIFMVTYLTFMIGTFYVYCYITEAIQMESFAFAQAAYECEWYKLPPRKAKYLILLIQSGRKPVAITAGKFCVLNMTQFGSVIKTSIGYLSFLITMRRNET